jgi:hypothetical protein
VILNNLNPIIALLSLSYDLILSPIKSKFSDSILFTASLITLLLKKRTSASMNNIYGVVTSLAPLFLAILTGPPSMISTFNR